MKKILLIISVLMFITSCNKNKEHYSLTHFDRKYTYNYTFSNGTSFASFYDYHLDYIYYDVKTHTEATFDEDTYEREMEWAKHGLKYDKKEW